MSGPARPSAAPKPSAKSIYEQRKRYSTVVMADVSQYAVNHLVTFCLGEEDGVHTVEDASRKLAAMDAQARIWAQEMLLQVSAGHVKLLDGDSKEELESYGLNSIVRCEAVRPPGQTRSLLLLVCQEPDRPQPDVHYFQGLRVGAELIREDVHGALQAHRSGSGDRRAAALRATQEELKRTPSPGPADPPFQRRPSTRVAIAPRERLLGPRGQEEAAVPEEEDGVTQTPAPDLASLEAERNVGILNHILDDVESFVAKLQKSAEATRVLEHRERGRRARRRAPGEGLLTLRAKPPTEEEYTDILQKIKYSFSLLARLRSNITDPSAPELLHFLLGPLQMVVDTSGGPSFAQAVQQPHLTAEAVALLKETLTAREAELWTSLGDAWTKARLELPPEEGTPYSPVFYSGWEPAPTSPGGQAWEDPVEGQHRHERRRWQQSAPQIEVNGHTEPDSELEPGPGPEPRVPGKWVLCNYDFQARNGSELSVHRGDLLEVLDDARKWWKVQDPQGQQGYVPYNILTSHPGPRSRKASPARELEQRTPPPPLAPAPPRPRWGSTDSLDLDAGEKEKFAHMLSVNEELQARLAQGPRSPRSSSRGAVTARLAPPEPPLSPGSPAPEVRAWLLAKGFSPGTVIALGDLTGAQLFSLKKDELRAVSPEEGARLYSQVTGHRALQQDSEKLSELEAVMEKQKRKVEGETGGDAL
ncbi:epidermal growth factor receptor kinase substrate 8-like protein 1 [Monodelphis domestica]|uniref:epidermal growth factor receptor kinase substrate 8-like protein 1 n=1 Tax=Monodelphis domestica TaxID=13616 RepID=UPI0024E1C608|nr:epidermal growth factor receptor kinase substrate 8-like protein 1 [Monodelphis domestica]XP_056652596.1 epidermal growth factor receptor kinase substrate 8-like protein 1 [Monodelphis domestica]